MRLVEAAIPYSVNTTSRLCIFTVLFKSSVCSTKGCSIDMFENSSQFDGDLVELLFYLGSWIVAISTIHVISRDPEVKAEHNYNHRNEINLL